MIDIVYLFVFLGGNLAIQNRRIFPGADFIDAYAPILWVVFCGLVAASYPVFSAKAKNRNRRWFSTASRLVLLFLVSVAIDFGLYRWQHPSEFFETSLQGAVFFVAIPGVIISFVSAAICGMILNRRSTTS